MLRRRNKRRNIVRTRNFTDAEILAVRTILAVVDEEEEPSPHRGSVFGRRTIMRDRYDGYQRLMRDYFVPNPVFDEHIFRRRFRMPLPMFRDICDDVAQANEYFRLGYDAAGKAGFHTNQKVTAVMRMLAYGGSADSLDEYIRMGESTVLEAVSKFTRTIVDIYGAEYLRQPNAHDIAKLLQKAEQRGFPGMLGSIDCMHWEWDKCPTSLQGQFRGHFKKPSIILEAVASYDRWIWHAFYGMPGSCNDINVLHRSPVFDRISSGEGPPVSYVVNGRQYNMGYYLADGIYPAWATLISAVPRPQNAKQKYFSGKQAEFRKDVECSFGILQAQYAILKGAAKMWHPDDLKHIVLCCIILHNMRIKYESERGIEPLQIREYEHATDPRLDPNRNCPEVEILINNHRQIRSRPANEMLKLDLIEHVWNHGGNLQV